MAIILNQGQQIGEALGQIGQGLGGFIQQVNDPDRELRQRMQLLLASNPDLAQQFANMEAVTPGSAQNMLGRSPRFFGGDQYNNILQSIRNTGPDALTQERIDIRENEKQLDQIQKEKVMQQGLDIANPLLERFNATIQDRAVESVKPAQPDAKSELDQKDFLRWRKQQLATGRVGTFADYQREKMQDDLLKDKVRASEFERKKRERISVEAQKLPERDIRKDAIAFMQGKLANETAEAYMYSDEYRQLWDMIVKKYMDDNSEAARDRRMQWRLGQANQRLTILESLQRERAAKFAQIKELNDQYKDELSALKLDVDGTQKRVLTNRYQRALAPLQADLDVKEKQLTDIMDAIIEVDGFKKKDITRAMELGPQIINDGQEAYKTNPIGFKQMFDRGVKAGTLKPTDWALFSKVDAKRSMFTNGGTGGTTQAITITEKQSAKEKPKNVLDDNFKADVSKLADKVQTMAKQYQVLKNAGANAAILQNQKDLTLAEFDKLPEKWKDRSFIRGLE